MIEHDDDPAAESENPSQEEHGPSPVFDRYRSLIDPNLQIFVEKDEIPPFRFKAGGWELVQSSIALKPAMIARITKNGFFMFRANGIGPAGPS